ncbi:unnamed protein product [Phytophthora lilii]|uniref:Unnamed protein product n=1 Tax=Phytophthora lilii TaxID=2077276 RepID=A0A9W6U6G5_9STRA|nr:unnamed protein product [Phytophthora lilii]
MERKLEIKTTGVETLMLALPLASEHGESLTMAQLQSAAAALLPDEHFSLRYTDSDGDHVTIAGDTDVKELEKHMQDEQRQSLEVLVVPQQRPAAKQAATAVRTQLRGLVTAMSKLTAKPEATPTLASVMGLLVTSLQALDVADDTAELATVKKELLLVLQDDGFREAVGELGATEEFKELTDAMVAAVYEEDAEAIQDAATAHFDGLLVFAQRIVARCPSLKSVLVSVTKSLMTGLVRYNDEEMDGSASDSSSSCYSSDQDTVGVEGIGEETPLHRDVGCNGCEKAPLVGVRYKSLDVPHFDLCEECEASGRYMRYEPFIKITDPSRAPKQKRKSEMVHPYVTCDGCKMTPIVGVRFKSETKADFDLCEACEASGKWTESHGLFTTIDKPRATRTLKFTCRRGHHKLGHHGRLGHGKFGHHHGHGPHRKIGHHHGKFGHRHGCHGKLGHHHDDDDRRHGKLGRHSHHRPSFLGHGSPSKNLGPHEFSEYGHPEFHDHGFPLAFDEHRRRHHAPPGFGSPGYFGHFGHFDMSTFAFADPSGPPMWARGFEHGWTPFPTEFKDWRHHGFHGQQRGRHGHHTRFCDNDGEDDDGSDRVAGVGKKLCDSTSRTGVPSGEGMSGDDSTEAQGRPHQGKDTSITTEGQVAYNETMDQLAAMGSNDTEKNIRALEIAGGNIGGAVNALLSE